MLGNIGIVQLIIVLLIIALLFGTKRLRQLGSDLGKSIKGFKQSMTDTNHDTEEANKTPHQVDMQHKSEATEHR